VNKADLVKAISNVCCSRAEAAKVVDATINSITKSLKKGEPVTFVGFGTFTVRKRKARTGRNPQTGKPLMIAARKVPVFRPGAALRAAVK